MNELNPEARASLSAMAIVIHPHARARTEERGVTEDEIITTINRVECFPEKRGRTGFRLAYPFRSGRDGKFFQAKQVVVFGVDEGADFIVITVVVKCF